MNNKHKDEEHNKIISEKDFIWVIEEDEALKKNI